MGVNGLTSYVNRKSDVYFQDHCLKNCLLVIDGYALAYSLYNSYHNIGSAFGGDYNKYGKIIEVFFSNLDKCKVTPIVVCDGGYEKRKVNTIKKRSLKKVFSFQRLSPLSRNYDCFPLMLKHVFREVLLAKKVTLVQSDFEADSEVAALARKLDAPVLSNDSDFFIFDVAYIPITSLSLNNYEKNSCGEYFICCQIFRLDSLLNGLGGLPKTMLPLLATILGNDYIKASQFKNFYTQLGNKSKTKHGDPKRVEKVVSWLRNEDFESALEKILRSLKKHDRKNVKKSIKMVIDGYKNLDTPLLNCLPRDIQLKCKIDSVDQLASDFDKLVCDEGESDSDTENEVALSECPSSESDVDGTEGSDSCGEVEEDIPSLGCKATALPSWMLAESRKANLSPTIITIVSLRAYFFDPQAEDYTLPHAGSLSLPILQTIMGYLNVDSITCWSRMKCNYSGSQLHCIPPGISFTEPYDLNRLSEPVRKKIILETLQINEEACLTCFPSEWQLYIMSVVYWLRSTNVSSIRSCHIHGLIITLIVVNVIYSKIGTFWEKKKFIKRYGAELNKLSNQRLKKHDFSQMKSIDEIIKTLGVDECITAMNLLITFFHVDPNLKRRPQNFSLQAIHSFSQFQYSYEFATTLNSLMMMPFKRSNISMFYNGTFLYNVCCHFKGRANVISFIENFFNKQPTIFFLYKTIFDNINKLCGEIPLLKVKMKRPKTCKKVVKKIIQPTEKPHGSTEELFEDVNNKFYLLTKV